MDKVQTMLEWLQGNGGLVNAAAELRDDPIMGTSLVASSSIPPNEALIGCPVDLIITPEIAVSAICNLLDVSPDDLTWPAGSSSTGRSWNERMRICVYLCLHWIYIEDNGCAPAALPSSLRHWLYIASLPSPEDTLTPLRFSREEMALLQGTNLYGAVEDREREWRAEAEAVRLVSGLEGVSWERYLTAATYLSSRAFPSSLVHDTSPDHAAVEGEVSHPVLIPGLDLLNRSSSVSTAIALLTTDNAEAPVLWRANTLSTSTGTPVVTIESTSRIEGGEQTWNNYGPRSNEELLLGYGFVIPDNPHDTVVLKLGSSNIPADKRARLQDAKLDAGKRYHLRRDGVIDGEPLQVLRVVLSDEQSIPEHHHHGEHARGEEEEDEHAQMEKEQRELELELDVLGMLGGMLDDKLAKLDDEPVVAEARPAVRGMCRIYRQGQKDILSTAMDKLSDRIDRLEQMLDSGMTCSCCM